MHYFSTNVLFTNLNGRLKIFQKETQEGGGINTLYKL